MIPDFIHIDDDKTMLFLLNVEFKKHLPSKKVISFNEPELAVNYILENKQKLNNTIIFLDLNMPVLDGFQVLDILQKLEHDFKIIIVTSSIYNEDRDKALNCHLVINYLTKPIKGDVLLKIINGLEEK